MANDDTLTDTEISEWEQVVTAQVWNTLEAAFQSWINANMGQLLNDAMSQINSNSDLTNLGQVYDGLSYELVGEDKYTGVQGNFSTVVGQNQSQLIEGSNTVTINQTDTKTVTGDCSLTMQQNNTVSTYIDSTQTVLGNLNENTGFYKSVNLATSLSTGQGDYAGTQGLPTSSSITDYSNNAGSSYQGISGNLFSEVAGNVSVSVGTPLSGSYPSQSNPIPTEGYVAVENYNGNRQTTVNGDWKQTISGDSSSDTSGNNLEVTRGNSNTATIGAVSSVVVGATNSTFVGVALANSLNVSLTTSLVEIGWTGLTIASTPWQLHFEDAGNINTSPLSLEIKGFRIM